MRRYLLDSGPLAAYLNGRERALDLATPWIACHEVATSILVYGEVTEYIKGFPDFLRRHTELRRLLREIYPYFLTYPILDRYVDLRRQMRPSTGLIGDIDTLIAATALERDLTVVTIDKDFERVPGIKVALLAMRA
ncbi:MAG: type II toxin-antitoxin system VapC family toxin [Chloroflexi bacterium]|nr:type II toxin-antitoxin system VapC family toxin [Chloroflexota bacterium]